MLLLNDKPVEYFYFPGGEIQVKLPADIQAERVILTWKPSSSHDIMLLLLTVNALQEMGIGDIDLDILYLPYARQDRVCAPGEAFALKVMVNMLKYLRVNIRIYDPHSDVHLGLFDNTSVRVITQLDIFKRYNLRKKFDDLDFAVCSPDKGAYWKVSDIAIYYGVSAIAASKVRCPETGKISGIKVSDFPCGMDILVIDDICDGGATFIQLADDLKARGAGHLFLYVTHGIFSKGLEVLLERYDHIYCHHVLRDDDWQSCEHLTILREFKYES